MGVVHSLLIKENIFLDHSAKNKREVFEYLAEVLFKQGVITSKEGYIKDLQKRESQGHTALGDLLAIPHCKSDFVNKTTIVAITLENPIDDWTEDGEPVKLVFAISATNDANDLHIDILQEISKKLISGSIIKELLASKSSQKFLEILTAKSKSTQSVELSSDIILAVTACPSGMAHTYMAAEKLKEAAIEMGVTLFVETQGAAGVESEITEESLKKAKAVIFATEVAVKNEERFSHLPVINVPVAKGIKQPKELITQALSSKSTGKSYQNSDNGSESISKGEEAKRALMTGISYAVPILSAGL